MNTLTCTRLAGVIAVSDDSYCPAAGAVLASTARVPAGPVVDALATLLASSVEAAVTAKIAVTA
jgi:hypothetical protein